MSKESNKKAGVVYILTNPSFPEYVKIGYADDINKRLKELNRSECIPFAFRTYAVYEVNERLGDIAIHNMIDNINPNLRAIETFDGKKRKKEFYAMTADDAYAILKTIADISGTSDRLHKLTPEGHEIEDEKIAAEVEDSIVYTEEAFLSKADSEIRNPLFSCIFCRRNHSLNASCSEKLYIAFKAPKNFADVEVQKHALKIFVNMRKGTLKDPDNMADDVSNLGHWGNGDYRIYLKPDSDFEYVMGLINQAYKRNGDN